MEKLCKICSKKFKTREDRPGTFCSMDCHTEWKRSKSIYPFDRKCEYCNKTFKILHSRQKNNKFCSSSCSAKKSNAKRYGSKYKTKNTRSYFRDEVIKKFGHKCAICNYAKALDTHHIIPLADGGKNSIDNGIALCPNCHREVHKGFIATKELIEIKDRISSPD